MPRPTADELRRMGFGQERGARVMTIEDQIAEGRATAMLAANNLRLARESVVDGMSETPARQASLLEDAEKLARDALAQIIEAKVRLELAMN